MSHTPHLRASEPAIRPRKRPGRRVASLLLAAGLTVSAMTVLAASPASAASVCAPGTDTCVITNSVNTPLGPVTIAVSAANAVTVQLTPTAPSTLVIGIPFAFPPGPARVASGPAGPPWCSLRSSRQDRPADSAADCPPASTPTRFAFGSWP